MKQALAAMDQALARDEGVRAQRALIGMPQFAGAKSVACYMAMERETPTDLIIEECFRGGRKLCVPAYDPSSRQYAWARLDENEPMKAGPWGIMEPANPRPAAGAIDFAVIPGVAFDRKGNRLGHGRGFYDALLGSTAGSIAFKVGLAFDVQVVESVPVDGHDVAMNAVVSGAGIVSKNRNRKQ